MAVRKDDRRVQRTRELLRTALLSVIEEKGFEGASVQNFIDRANVGRATSTHSTTRKTSW
jgi:AcrR family transcriptional regulator